MSEEAFWAFVLERDAIRLRREAGRPWPWTDDPVLRDYHVTNVHRDLDPGTVWVQRELARRCLVEPDDLLFTIYAYRSLNRIQTTLAYGLPWRDELCAAAWVARLDDAKARGASLGSGRHLTFWARVRIAVPMLVDCRPMAEAVFEARDGAEAIRAMTRSWMGVGPFLGTQVVADLATYGPPGLFFGRDVRVPVSGGSRFALRMIFGGLTEAELDRRAFDERSAAGRRRRDLDQSPEEVRWADRLIAGQPTALSRPLTFVDLEHSLCEYARYARLAAGDLTRAAHMRRNAPDPRAEASDPSGPTRGRRPAAGRPQEPRVLAGVPASVGP